MSLSRRQLAIGIALLFLPLLLLLRRSSAGVSDEIPLGRVEKRSFAIEVKTIGELEAARATSIASTIRSDQAKAIYLIPDGVSVKQGDVLVRIDPTPFEEKVASLVTKYQEQQAHVAALEKALAWEIAQAERDNKTAEFEIEAAELEYNKIVKGDGPLEISRLKSTMQKACVKYEECNGYACDLESLEKEGFLNPAEVKQAKKRLEEDREAYETSKQQYESYIHHVHPMQVKKSEVSLKQAKMRKEETAKIRSHSVAKAQLELDQSRQALVDLHRQWRDASSELALTELKAPSPGMVVHREDFRGGQRRKPQVGDMMVRNQSLMDLPDLDAMVVKTKVREVDLSRVAVGKRATVEVDAYPQTLFSGVVTYIGVLATPDYGRASEEKYLELRVALDKNEQPLRPGMTARATVHGDQLEEVLSIPVHALFNDQKKNYCYVLSPQGTYECREVKLGQYNEEWAEIQEGLNEREEVCLSMPAIGR